MTVADDFAPLWASPPGDTIRDAMAERGLSDEAFAGHLGLDPQSFQDLLEGQATMTIAIARSLGETLGPGTEFWMTRDCQYRDDLERVAIHDWSQQMPLGEMARLGWIPETTNWLDGANEAMNFFAVSSADEWEHQYEPVLAGARFRSHVTKSPMQPSAVLAWLHHSRRIATEMNCMTWNRDEFASALDEIRTLTKLADPAAFLPRLRRIAAECGVAVVIAAAPRGCPLSGAAMFIDGSRPMISLSGRYLAEDHLWFTFFHEAAHLILHDKDRISLDEFGEKENLQVEDEEAEADEFASNTIIDPSMLAELGEKRKLTYFQIAKLAKQVNISPGVLVGQLQHVGAVDYSHFNKRKNRYKWNGPSLEIA